MDFWLPYPSFWDIFGFNMNAHEIRDGLLSRLAKAQKEECIEILLLLKATGNAPREAELEALCERDLSIQVLLPGLVLYAENHLKDLVLQKLFPQAQSLLFRPLSSLLEQTEISTATLKIILEAFAKNARNTEFLVTILPALNPHADRFPPSFFELLLKRSEPEVLKAVLRAVRNLPQPDLKAQLSKLALALDPETACLAMECLWLLGEPLLLKRLKEEIPNTNSELLEKLALSLHRVNQDPVSSEILLKLSENSDESLVITALRALAIVNQSRPLDSSTLRTILEAAITEHNLFVSLIRLELCFNANREETQSILEDFLEIFEGPHKAQIIQWITSKTNPAGKMLNSSPSFSRLFICKEKNHATSS